MAMFTIVRRFSPRNICLTRAFLSLKPRENYAASIFAAKSRCYSHPVSHDELRTMTKSEWEERLTPEQFSVCREQCTEPPFSGEFNSHYEKGMYTCVCCGTDLFSSKSKYDSGTGWPSFSDAYKSDKGLSNIIERPENSLDQSTFRTEVICRKCDSHLGHVFDDGPGPEMKRYCINSTALGFKPDSN